MAADDLDLINEALARMGDSPIAALTEETPKAAKIAAIYPTVRRSLLASHAWNWAVRTSRLDLLNKVPETGYARAFALPPDRIGLPAKILRDPRMPDHPLREFRCEGDELHCNLSAAWASCVRNLSPAKWDPAFREAAAVALAAALCTPLTHDTTLSANLQVQAWGTPSEGQRGGLIGRAMARDAANAGAVASAVASDPLTDSRHDGPWWGSRW